jgi:hypothetical protein
MLYRDLYKLEGPYCWCASFFIIFLGGSKTAGLKNSCQKSNSSRDIEEAEESESEEVTLTFSGANGKIETIISSFYYIL